MSLPALANTWKIRARRHRAAAKQLEEKEVRAVSINIDSAQRIAERSVCQVTELSMYDKMGHPIPHSLADQRMGVLDSAYKCLTCRGTIETCPGHTGHIVLEAPVYHVSFIATTYKVLSCVCHACSRLLVTPDSKYYKSISAMKDINDRLKALADRSLRVSVCPYPDCKQPQRVYSHHKLNITCYERKDPPKKKKGKEAKTKSTRPRKRAASEESEVDQTESDAESETEVEVEDSDAGGEEEEDSDACGEGDEDEGVDVDADIDVEGEVDESVAAAAAGTDDESNTDAFVSSSPYSVNKPPSSSARKAISGQQISFTAANALEILSGIDDSSLDILSFTGGASRPENAILVNLTVPSPRVRAPMVSRSDCKSDGENTTHLKKIIKSNMQVAKCRAKGADITKMRDILQRDIAAYFHNGSNGTAKAVNRSGAPLRSIMCKVKGKPGLMRNNMAGKRINWCARTVHGPGSGLDLDQVGLPEWIAMRIDLEETVHAQNIVDLQRCVNIGPRIIGGAVAIVRNGQQIDLRYSNRKRCQLRIGDKVKRHLRDGDYILFGRQPTLHRQSIMCGRVKLHSGKTVLLPLPTMKPLNADCDGDELLITIARAAAGIAECRTFMMVHHQICDAQERAAIGIVQDAAVMGYIGTRADVILRQPEMASMACEFQKRGPFALPYPAFEVVKPNGERVKMWTGKQAVSMGLPVHSASVTYIPGRDEPDQPIMTFPAPSGRVKAVNYRRGNGADDESLIIVDSELISGRFNKASVGPSRGSLSAVIFHDFGPDAARDYLSDMVRMLEHWISVRGFGMGLTDCDMGDKAKSNEIVNRCVDYISRNGHQMPETHIRRLVECARDYAGGVTIHDPDYPLNRMGHVVDSGAKGSRINIAQTHATLGQTILEGKRVSTDYSGNRSLPHFQKNSVDPEGRGYIKQGFVAGLNATSNYFHAMAGREGLVDTSSKTADVGYTIRMMMRAFEDARAHHDQTIRMRNQIISFAMGADAMEASKIELQSYPLLAMEAKDIRVKYGEEFPETEQLVMDSVQRRTASLWHSPSELEPSLRAPVAFQRILDSASQMSATSPLEGKVTVEACRKASFDLENWCRGQIMCEAKLDAFFALMRMHFHPRNIVHWLKLDSAALEWACSEVRLRFCRSIVPSGEMVGIVAGHSIGEPCQQMTFNTFHHAGWGVGTMAAAIPQLKNCITAGNSGASMEIFSHDPSSKASAIELARSLKPTFLRDICKSIRVIHDPDPFCTKVVEDRDLVADYASTLHLPTDFKDSFSSLVIRVELDRRKCLRVKHSPETISQLMDTALQGENHQWVVSPVTDKDWVIRVRVRKNSDRYKRMALSASKGKGPTHRAIDKALSSVRPLDLKSSHPVCEISIIAGIVSGTYTPGKTSKSRSKRIVPLSGIMVQGVPGLSRICIRKQPAYNQETAEKTFEYCVFAVGSNLKDVLKSRLVDPRRVFSTSLQDVFLNLGIEATYNALIIQISRIFKANGSHVSDRHIGILASVMCKDGFLTGLTRFRFHANKEVGFLGRASFEKTVAVLTQAAQSGETDPLEGMRACVLVGKLVPAGTNTVGTKINRGHFADMVQKSLDMGLVSPDQFEPRVKHPLMPELEAKDMPQILPFLYSDARFMKLVPGYEIPGEYKELSRDQKSQHEAGEMVIPDYSVFSKAKRAKDDQSHPLAVSLGIKNLAPIMKLSFSGKLKLPAFEPWTFSALVKAPEWLHDIGKPLTSCQIVPHGESTGTKTRFCLPSPVMIINKPAKLR